MTGMFGEDGKRVIGIGDNLILYFVMTIFENA